jgi:N-methylhydantoinase B
MSVDVFLAAVLQRKLRSIAEEMGVTILRTTRSPLLNQAGDLGTAIFNSRGEILEQAEYIPIISLSLRLACQHVRKFFDEDIHPGDVILHNDVYYGGLQHADTGVLVPVFHDREVVAWVACKGHQADIGGAVAGGCNPEATEVWQEAFRIPPVKVCDGGRMRHDVWNLIFSNVRLREVVEADVRALAGACEVARREVAALIKDVGSAVFKEATDWMMDSAEARMRAEIRAIPNGTYRGESSAVFDTKHGREESKIQVAITVRDEEIELDYTGTDPQNRRYTNAPFASSWSAAVMSFLMLVDPAIPHNDGIVRPIKVKIPEGTFLNPKFPAATFYGNFLSVPNFEAIMKAMSVALPSRVSAAWNRPLVARVTGINPETHRWYHDILFLGLKGGSGAVQGMDGYNQAAPVFCPALRTHDYELFEIQDPHVLIKHEYLTDSGGAGQWRGGLGVELVCRLNAIEMIAVTQGDGRDTPAFGLHGGGSGTVNNITLQMPDGSTYEPSAMEIISHLPSGTTLRQTTGGGGGFGNPAVRSIESIASDVRDGIVSKSAAQAFYGAVLTADGQVHLDETSRARAKPP